MIFPKKRPKNILKKMPKITAHQQKLRFQTRMSSFLKFCVFRDVCARVTCVPHPGTPKQVDFGRFGEIKTEANIVFLF